MTSLRQSPFYLLGATTRDDRRRIVELAEEKSLTLDSDVCTKARSDLTTPRNRLAVEMAWLPGLSPNSARVLVDNLHNHIDLVKKATTAPALAKANLLAAAIELLDLEMDVDQWCDWIVEFAYTVDMIEPEDVLREINEDRSVSGFPEVKGAEQIEVELRERQRYYTDTIKTALNRFSSDKLVDVVTRVVETTTDTGEEHGASLIHDLVERYETDANNYLQPEAENIKKLAEAILQAAHKGESAVKWGAVSRSVNGVPTGTDYTIAVGDNRSSAVIETRKGDIFSNFTDKLWRAGCVRLLTETLEALKSGECISFGGAVIDDRGVQLTNHKFLGDEPAYRNWWQVTYGSAGGSLEITAQDDKKVYVSLPYLTTPNAHILEAMIRLSFKKWTGRLSGLLND